MLNPLTPGLLKTTSMASLSGSMMYKQPNMNFNKGTPNPLDFNRIPSSLLSSSLDTPLLMHSNFNIKTPGANFMKEILASNLNENTFATNS